MGLEEKSQQQAYNQIDNQTVEDLMQAFIRLKRKHIEATNDKKTSEARALVLLRHAPEEGLQIIELSKKMYVSSPFITQLINKMEESGWIVRKNDPKDRRIVRVVLSDSGREAADAVKEQFHQRFMSLAEHLGPDDSRQLSKLLNKTFQFFESKVGE